MSKPVKKPLPEPKSADASFCSACPYCGVDGQIVVLYGQFYAAGLHLGEDGFAFSDAKTVNTDGEEVRCDACRREFSLAEVTR